MIGGISQHDSAEKIRDYKARVEPNNRREKIGETVVIVTGHLPVPGNLYRLQPRDICEEVPESERENRTATHRTEQRGGNPGITLQRPPGRDGAGDRGGK